MRRFSALLACLLVLATPTGPAASTGAEPPVGSAAGTWSVVPEIPLTAGNSQLLSVSCTDAGTCLASGTHEGLRSEEYAEVWDGAVWTTTPTPPGPPGRASREIETAAHCVAADFCVRGHSRWNGSAWTDLPGHPDTRLVAFDCVSTTSCVGVGYAPDATRDYWFVTGIWNGTTWSVTESGTRDDAFTSWTHLSCETATFCLATRELGGLAGTSQEVVRWDGAAWSSVDGWFGAVSDLACASPTACFAAGSTALPDSGDPPTPTFRSWDGVAMTEAVSPLDSVAALSCAGPRDCLAIGEGGARARWDGVRWRTQSPGSRSSSPGGSPSAVSCASAECVTVGRVLVNGSFWRSYSEVYDGYSWTQVPTANPTAAHVDALTRVSCWGDSGAGRCAALGRASSSTGTAMFYSDDLAGLSQFPLAGGPAYADLACAPQGYPCLAVGSRKSHGKVRPLALRRAGPYALDPVPLPRHATSGSLAAVACAGERSCVAVGRWTGRVRGSRGTRPLMVRFDGKSWRLGPRPVTTGIRRARLTGVSCPGHGACTVVGVGNVDGRLRGLVGRWRAGRLRLVPAPLPARVTTSSLVAVDCSAATSCAAVGAYRKGGTLTPYLLARGASGWSRATLPVRVGRLTAVDCPADGACRAVGAGPAGMLAVSGGHGGWLADTVSGVPSVASWDVSCVDATTCTAVGGRGPGVVLAGSFPR